MALSRQTFLGPSDFFFLTRPASFLLRVRPEMDEPKKRKEKSRRTTSKRGNSTRQVNFEVPRETNEPSQSICEKTPIDLLSSTVKCRTRFMISAETAGPKDGLTTQKLIGR